MVALRSVARSGWRQIIPTACAAIAQSLHPLFVRGSIVESFDLVSRMVPSDCRRICMFSGLNRFGGLLMGSLLSSWHFTGGGFGRREADCGPPFWAAPSRGCSDARRLVFGFCLDTF